MLSWTDHVAAWAQPPVDDVGYIPSQELLGRSDEDLRRMVDDMRTARYRGWRNHGNRWREVMGLDTLQDRDILDFGCGTGIEALELALAGNRVSVADIAPSNVALAARVLDLYGIGVADRFAVTNEPPYITCDDARFDVFYCNGVLHHIEWPRAIMERAHHMLRPGGEVRLMVYSDAGWRIATGTEPPAGDVTGHPGFTQFVRYFDAVGAYATWYSETKLQAEFGDLFTIERCQYLTENDQYLGAVLRKKT